MTHSVAEIDREIQGAGLIVNKSNLPLILSDNIVISSIYPSAGVGCAQGHQSSQKLSIRLWRYVKHETRYVLVNVNEMKTYSALQLTNEIICLTFPRVHSYLTQ